MKIVIAGGNSQAEFIVANFKGKGNELIVINPNKDVADSILKRCRVPVYVGSPWRKYALEETDSYDADVFIALCDKDTDNFASCTLAKRCFNARKTICVVSNPKNVDLYTKLGIDSVISSTYLLSESIQRSSSVESMIKTLSLDNDKVNVIEATILSKHRICDKKIMEIGFPKYASIAAIYRNYQIIIPNGQIELKAKDVLLVVTAKENQKKILAYLQAEKDFEPLKEEEPVVEETKKKPMRSVAKAIKEGVKAVKKKREASKEKKKAKK